MVMHSLVAALTVFALFSGSVSSAFAQTSASQNGVRINLQNGMPVVGDFTVGPARVILNLAPGEERTVELQVTNREGRRAALDLTTEDFIADKEREGTPTFFAENIDGPFPARAWIDPAVDRLELNHGERAFVPVTIRVPQNAEPGDHQAALIFTRDVESQPTGGFTIVSRVAALFIISVEGDIVREGDVESLTSRRVFNWFLPVWLRLNARNAGTVHIAPVGTVEIRNIFGIVVDEIPVKNWVILRDSTRYRDLEWKPAFALGYYRATANLTAFDGMPLTPVSTSFWAVPLLPLLLVLFAIFVVSFAVQYVSARFEIRRKSAPVKKAPPRKKKK